MNFAIHLPPRHLAACVLMIVLSSVATLAKTNEGTARPRSANVETIFNLADFGAIGDGVTDDGPALQSALDAVEVAGGGTLFIPTGKYLIATPVAKDFASVSNAVLRIQGVPSDTMPAPPTALGNELAAGLDLTSELIPATGEVQVAISLSNIHQLLIEHVGFTGREAVASDALITIYLRDIGEATIRHCEFYGLYSVYGNIIRADRTELSIELTVFLGCSANSGVYAPIVENVEWRRVSISNSIFLDYGNRPFWGKLGLGAPLSWINIANAQPSTLTSPRREVIVRDTFLDEGGWIGITVLPYRYCSPCPPIDLIYISGLKMNVSNLNTTGHMLYDARNLMIENSHYGWSHLTSSAVDINRFENVILDKLTCIASADRIKVDAGTQRVTVINSVYRELASLAQSTTVMETSPADDPVQYVRQQFLSVIGRQPEPAAHFYWSDLLIRCGNNTGCLNQTRSQLGEYLDENPPANFTITGSVLDESGAPLGGAAVNLTGSLSAVTTTDSQGGFRFSRLPTSGNYNVTLSKPHYNFLPANQNITRATADRALTFAARLNRFAITGTVTDESGARLAGATVNLTGYQSAVTTTDSQGIFRFPGLATIGNYNVSLSKPHYNFLPANQNITGATADVALTFAARLNRFAVTGTVTDESGARLAGATVNLTGYQSVVTTTDSQGIFRLSGLPTIGNYNVSLSKPHYNFLPANQNITGATADVALTFAARLNRFAVTGTVTDESGAPLGGATVNLTGSQSLVTTTDSQGSFRFSGLPTIGNYNVSLSKPHYNFLPANQNITGATADMALTFAARLNRFAITGTVTDESGAPLGGASVNLTGSQSMVTTTDSQGSFRFSGLLTIGSYNVSLSKPHYNFLPANQNITGATADVALTFAARLNRFAITGTVTDESGARLAGATVNLTGYQSVVTTTDSQGSFRLPGLATIGNYNISLSKPHYNFLPANQNITGATADVALTFAARLNRFAITGTVTDESGAPLGGATVNLTGHRSEVTTTDSQGIFRLSGLPTIGSYNISLSKPHYNFLPANQNITGATADVALTFAARLNRFAVTGTVTDESGAPLGGATVNLTGYRSEATTTDSQGIFRLSGLPTIGSYNVSLSKPHYNFLPANQNITGATADMALAFAARLNRHAIAGRIAGANGAGISGILVRLDQAPAVTQVTDVNGSYSFTQLPAGQNYTVTPMPNTDFVFAPMNTAISDLAGDRTANFVGLLRPEISTVAGSNVAVALDSVTFIAQPFALLNSLDFINDGFLRVTIFAKNVEPSATLSQISLLAEDSRGQTHPLQIEYMGNVAGQSWLKQFNLKLDASSFSSSCIKVKLSVIDVSSSDSRICIGDVIDLPGENGEP